MSEQNFNQSLKPFCGNSNATGLFMEANYPSGVYTETINSDKNPEIEGYGVEGIMLAKNYRPSARIAGMQDNDIHNQYIDFIVRTALFHREIDNPTTLGSNLAGVKEAFEKATDELLEKPIAEIAARLRFLETKTIDINENRYNLSDFRVANATYLDEINLRCILDSDVESFLGNCYSRDGNVRNVSMLTGDLCIAIWYVNKDGTFASKHLKAILDKHLANRDDIFDAVIRDIYNAMKSVCNTYKKGLRSYLGLAGVNPDDANSIKKLVVRARDYGNSLKQQLTEVVYDIVKRILNVVANPHFTTLDQNHHANQLFEDVFLNWGNLDPQAREFYRAHVRLYRKIGDTIGIVRNQAGWEDITYMLDGTKSGADLAYVRTLSKNTLRINLMKERPGAERVLFSATLPYVPVSKINKLWYTRAGNAYGGNVVSLTIVDKNTIRDIYHNIYMGLPSALQTFTQYANVAGKTEDFDVDDAYVVKNMIKSRKSAPVGRLDSVTNETLLVEDLVRKVVYYRDNSGLYRIDANGAKIPYNNDNIRADNCSGSMLKTNDQVKCSRFIRDCILGGNSDNLTNCIAQLSDKNFFVHAQEELEEVDPDVAIQILRAFEFGKVGNPVNGGEYLEIQSFDTWAEKVLPSMKANVRNAILGNPKLCDYLKGVVAFVNSHPAILNKGWTGEQVQTQPDDQYLRALEKRLWINPRPDDVKVAESKMLVQAFTTPMFGLPAPGRMINPFSNTVIGRGSMFVSPRVMAGGANSYEDSLSTKINANGKISETMEAMFANVHDDLRKAGYSLTHNDHFKLENSFKELEKTETRLSELHGMLRTLTDLNSLFKASGCVPNEYVGNVSIDNLRNRSDTLAYLAQNINEVQNCINNNITDQNSRCSELVKYYTALVDASVGKANNDIRVTSL